MAARAPRAFTRPVPVLAAAGAGFVQLTGSALYAIAVSHTYDGSLRPMTTAVGNDGGRYGGCRGLRDVCMAVATTRRA